MSIVDYHHHSTGRMGSGLGAPQAPVISRPTRPSSSRRSRSRSRSRSPPPSHHRSRYSNSSRERSRRQSPPSSYTSRPTETYRKTDTLPIFPPPSHSQLSSRPAPASLQQQQSISLLAGETAFPMTHWILSLDDVKIPRRAGEGSMPIFERAELREAMIRRLEGEDEQSVPSASAESLQQRVIAIIREPIGGLDGYRLLGSSSISKDTLRDSGYSRHLQPVSPEVVRPSIGGPRAYRLAPPRRERPRRPSPERPAADRKRDLLDELREGESFRGREREEFIRSAREREVRKRARIQEREGRDLQERANHPGSTSRRSRSPVRILRERADWRWRSRSVTPLPMPPEIRRQLPERDLRNKLSRPLTKPPSKFDSEHHFRSWRGGRGFSRGFTRGRGFPRGLRSRGRGRP